MKKIPLILFVIILQWHHSAYAQIPDTVYISPSGGNNGGPACGYLFSFTLDRNMPIGDQLFLLENDNSFCTGTSSGFYIVNGSPNNSYNWYSYPDGWQGNSFGPEFCYITINANSCSVCNANLNFMYISADGSGIVHASISNMQYYTNRPAFSDPFTVSYINSACNVPQSVNLDILLNTSCAQNGGYDIHTIVYFGDGQDTSIWTYGVNTAYYNLILQHNYTMPGSYSVEASVNGLIRVANDLIRVGLDSCNTVTGKLYADLNSNCIYDAGDSVFVSYPIRISANGQSIYFAITDSLGNYSFTLPDTGATYYINFDTTANGLHLVCPISGYTVTTLPSSGNDFAVNCQNSFDLTGFINANHLISNMNSNVYISARNLNCNATNAQVKLIKSPLLSLVSSSILPDSVRGDTLYWSYANADFLNHFENELSFHTDSMATLNDTVCLQLIVEPVASDFNPLNNSFEVCRIVNAPFDPNGKEENLSPDGSLTYTINFENTGTSYVTNASIVDTIDMNLDMNTFQVVASSHPIKTYIFSGNVVKFSFDNIMLPDTGNNQGFVSYSIKPKSNAPFGSIITNKAFIYFDFNPAVSTNATYYTIPNPLNINSLNEPEGIIIYPNPSTSQITISYHTNSTSQTKIEIYNTTSQKVKTLFNGKQTEGKQQQSYDISSLAPGIYFVKLTVDGFTDVKKLVKM